MSDLERSDPLSARTRSLFLFPSEAPPAAIESTATGPEPVVTSLAPVAILDPHLGQLERLLKSAKEAETRCAGLVTQLQELEKRTTALAAELKMLNAQAGNRRYWRPALAAAFAARVLVAAIALPFAIYVGRSQAAQTNGAESSSVAAASVPAPAAAPALPVAPRADIALPAEPSTAPPVAAPAAPPARRPGRPLFIGTLALDSRPSGASVIVNGRRVGVTPVRLPGLAAGSHVVWVERDGYVRWTGGVHVPASRTTRLNVTLDPVRASR